MQNIFKLIKLQKEMINLRCVNSQMELFCVILKTILNGKRYL